nr:MAG TPA_asm: hypothetical protein [Bacteriophage sp.]DAS26483.1 MAG TPA: hypothetical protein [Caudoviricetes sp.]
MSDWTRQFIYIVMSIPICVLDGIGEHVWG